MVEFSEIMPFFYRVKRYFLLLVILFFLACWRGFGVEPVSKGEYVISELKFFVGEFKDLGPGNHTYIKRILRLALVESLKKIPFFTLTEEQQSLVKDSLYFSMRSDGKSPTVILKNNLLPVIVNNVPSKSPLVIAFTGMFRVSDGSVNIWISAENRKIGYIINNYHVQSSTDDLIKRHEDLFIPFVKDILNYRVSEVRINTRPDNSLIFIDDNFAGKGSTGSLLIVPGLHKLWVYADGYREWHEIINVAGDEYKKDIKMSRIEQVGRIIVKTEPSGAQVYVDEKFFGLTPIALNKNSGTVTLVKDGYRNNVFNLKDINGKEVYVKLKPTEQYKLEKNIAEKRKKISNVLYYTGLGFTFLAALSGARVTYYTQKAELYRNIDEAESSKYEKLKNVYSGLMIGAASTSVVIFSISFAEMLSYFKLYEKRE